MAQFIFQISNNKLKIKPHKCNKMCSLHCDSSDIQIKNIRKELCDKYPDYFNYINDDTSNCSLRFFYLCEKNNINLIKIFNLFWNERNYVYNQIIDNMPCLSECLINSDKFYSRLEKLFFNIKMEIE